MQIRPTMSAWRWRAKKLTRIWKKASTTMLMSPRAAQPVKLLKSQGAMHMATPCSAWSVPRSGRFRRTSMSTTRPMAILAAMRMEKMSCKLCLTFIRHHPTNMHRHCTEGDTEVTLSRAAADTHSGSSSTASGDGVSCHDHAGVP